MQKTVTPSLTLSMISETDGHGGVVTVLLRCRESVVKLTIHDGISISHAPSLAVCPATIGGDSHTAGAARAAP